MKQVPLTWIVVANRLGANFYQKRGVNGALELVRELAFPEGRLRDQEIESDRPGRANTPGHGRRSAFSAAESAHDHLAQKFAQTLAQELSSSLHQKAFDQLVLVAEPSFLGLLRSELDGNLKAKVAQELDRDLSKFGQKELSDYLNGALDLRVPAAAS